MRIIAFCGPKGSGKDEAAKCLLVQNKAFQKQLFRHAPMAEGIKLVAQDFFGWTFEQMSEFAFKETPIPYWPGGPVEPPRQFLMDGANWLRERFGGAIHAARWARHGSTYHTDWAAHVVTDMRFPEELDIFRHYGGSLVTDNGVTASQFLPIYIERPEAEEKLAALKASGDKMANDPSESHYEYLKQYCREHGVVIQNTGDIMGLHNQVMTSVKVMLTHWQYWNAESLVTADDLINNLRAGKV